MKEEEGEGEGGNLVRDGSLCKKGRVYIFGWSGLI